jgi:hypothetical protein
LHSINNLLPQQRRGAHREFAEEREEKWEEEVVGKALFFFSL